MAFSDDIEIGVNASFMLNLKANFRNIRGFVVPQGPDPGPATGGGVDRFYDDGFVRVDDNGNPRGLTGFWGYDNANQVVGDTLVLTSTRIVPDDSVQLLSLSSDAKDVADFSQNGAEIFIKFPKGDASFGDPVWGFRESLIYYKIDIDYKQTMRISTNRRVNQDTFQLGGITPPSPPYKGPSIRAPLVPLIDDTPDSRTENVTPSKDINLVQNRKLEADMIGFGLGPYWDFYPHDRLGISFNAGILLTWIFSDFRTQNIQIADTMKNQDSDSQSKFLIGGFIEAKASFELNRNLAIQGGVRYQLIEDFEHKHNDEIAELDFSKAAILTIGLSYLH